MTVGRLSVDIRSYWHPGAGRGAGAVLDAAAHRASDGLPALPGRHLKGLLRDAVQKAEAWGWYPERSEIPRYLFGDRTERLQAGMVPRPGLLRVSEARLPEATASWLAHTDKGRALLPHLYRALYATAVQHETGVAYEKSLRGIEVVVPLSLEARIEVLHGDAEELSDWAKLLRAALPLVRAVGAHRTRGLGRAVLDLELME